MKEDDSFPSIISDLPQADIPIEGLSAHLLQCNHHQVLFMSVKKDVQVSEHTHEAQWGVVLEGEIELTISGKKQIYKKGDTYFIPRGVHHSAMIRADYKDLTLFNQKDRYKAKDKE